MKCNILQAVQFVTLAWEKVSAKTISNCFKHCKILPTAVLSQVVPNVLAPAINYAEEDYNALEEIRENIEKCGINDPIPEEEWINFDQGEET